MLTQVLKGQPNSQQVWAWGPSSADQAPQLQMLNCNDVMLPWWLMWSLFLREEHGRWMEPRDRNMETNHAVSFQRTLLAESSTDSALLNNLLLVQQQRCFPKIASNNSDFWSPVYISLLGGNSQSSLLPYSLVQYSWIQPTVDGEYPWKQSLGLGR